MAKATQETVVIRPIEKASAKIRIVGDSPLIMHAWSAKAKREMLGKQLGVTKTAAREKKNPVEDFVSSMYWLTPMPEEFTAEAVAEALRTARFGFPVTAIKQAAITAAYQLGWTPNKTSLRGAFYIEPEINGYYAGDLQIAADQKSIEIIPNAFKPESMIEIKSDVPVMREDMVRLGGMGNPADVRYRGQFDNWSAELTVTYNLSGQYSLDQIVNIINAGGFACGIGEWRPEKDGSFGQFHVERA